MTASGTLCAVLPSPLPLSGAGIGGGPVAHPDFARVLRDVRRRRARSQTFLQQRGAQTSTGRWAPSRARARRTTRCRRRPRRAAHARSELDGHGHGGGGPVARAEHRPCGVRGAGHDHDRRSLRPSPRRGPLRDAPRRPALAVGAEPALRSVPDRASTVAPAVHGHQQRQPGSPAANVSLSVTGSGAALTRFRRRPSRTSRPAGRLRARDVTFDPSSAVPYPASIRFHVGQPVHRRCPGRPADGHGHGGKGFGLGDDPRFRHRRERSEWPGQLRRDGPRAHAAGVNTGNQEFHITGLSLGLGASSPYGPVGRGDVAPLRHPHRRHHHDHVTPAPSRRLSPTRTTLRRSRTR